MALIFMDSGDRYTEIAAIEKLRYGMRVAEVNEELLEQLTSSLRWLLHYSKKHNIPLPETDKISLMLLRTMEITDKIPSNESLQGRKPDGDLTEPEKDSFRRLLGA